MCVRVQLFLLFKITCADTKIPVAHVTYLKLFYSKMLRHTPILAPFKRFYINDKLINTNNITQICRVPKISYCVAYSNTT